MAAGRLTIASLVAIEPGIVARIAALRDPVPAVRAYASVMVLEHYFSDQPESFSFSLTLDGEVVAEKELT